MKVFFNSIQIQRRETLINLWKRQETLSSCSLFIELFGTCLKMEVTLTKEDKLQVTLNDGATYQGDFCSYCEKTETLTMNNIVQSPDSLQVTEPVVVQLDDIMKLHIIRDQQPPPTECVGSRTPKPLRNMSKGDYFRLVNSQRCFQLVSDTGSTFHTAMMDLQKSKIIGVYGRDAVTGRKKKLYAIALSTETSIYVFDLLKLRNKPFEKGLRKVLESDSVVKVVYDCRLLSDCLYHKHGIKITNVRDVEAEDVVITYNETGNIRRITRRFSSLIQMYLGLPGHSVEEDSIKKPAKKFSCNSKLQAFMANYASYLIPVHKSIESLHLQKLADVSKMYSEVIRHSHDLNYLYKSDQFVMAREMRDLLIPPVILSKKLSEIDF